VLLIITLQFTVHFTYYWASSPAAGVGTTWQLTRVRPDPAVLRVLPLLSISDGAVVHLAP